MVKRERPARPAAFKHQRRQLFILFEHDWKILVRKGGGIVRRSDDRLHAELVETEFEHGFNIP